MKFYSLVIISILFLSCRTQKKLFTHSTTIENNQFDTLVVRAQKMTENKSSGPAGAYRASATRTNDLLHTRLEIRFDMGKRLVLGKAYLSFRPWFYPVDKIVLDAKRFKINQVGIIKEDSINKLHYKYENDSLTVFLDRYYNKEEKYTVFVDYVAHPMSGLENKSYPFNANQGLFFIDPDESDPYKPTQIWTQGETENNSCWFPTIDKPNERCTQEVFVTVNKKYKTLSNGVLVSSIENKDDTRTDYWKLDLPHAPYLFALVVGDFAVESELWNDIAIDYYVEEKFASNAKQIFNHTPEMLSFFSAITGVAYPWPKYSQIAVRNFVSGAMENTTMVIFAEGFQKDPADLEDFSNDLIVAHEMFHHWFGNLVTCESWANLTLNEGFANYAEYLWTEYKYGKEEADYHRQGDLNDYLSGSYSVHPLIHFEYKNRESMFDLHSYNKGGLVLHMLRKYVGDEAFFASLNKYLNDNAYSDVEAHELRLAFEEVTGEDLNWFFDQWFFDEGHPVLEVNYEYADSLAELSLHIDQIQSEFKHRPVFSFPLTVEIFMQDGSSRKEAIWVKERSQTFNFRLAQPPALILVDAEHELLAGIRQNKTTEQYAFQYKNATHPIDRNFALNALKRESKYKPLFEEALWDPFWKVRLTGLQNIGAPYSAELIDRLRELIIKDDKSFVRATALKVLEKADSALEEELLVNVVNRDSSALVISAALSLLLKKNPGSADALAQNFLETRSASIANVVAGILAASGKEKYLSFYESRLFEGRIYRKSGLINAYSKVLKKQSHELILERSKWIARIIGEKQLKGFKKQLLQNIVRDQLQYFIELKNKDVGNKQLDYYISELESLL